MAIRNDLRLAPVTGAGPRQPVLVDAGGEVSRPDGSSLFSPGAIEIGGVSVPIVHASRYGLRPNIEADQSDLLEAALADAITNSRVIAFADGEYRYSRSLIARGLGRAGMISNYGRAKFVHTGSTVPELNNAMIRFETPVGSAAGTRFKGLHIYGLLFTQPNRPDEGLSNDAQESGTVIRAVNGENISVHANEWRHVYGTALLLRGCKNARIGFNKLVDNLKDGFHITGDSEDIWRYHNEVYGGGDDSFPVVGYTNIAAKPRRIYDLMNKVYGVRYARAFAYVGCSDVQNTDCYVDGLLPEFIPQRVGPTGDRLNTRCGLYIAGETFGATPELKTYGNERIKVRGMQIVHTAPSVSAAGVLGTGYEAITVFGSNEGNKDLDIEATVRDIAGRGFICSGGTGKDTIGLRLDLTVENNRDPLGLSSLTDTPNTMHAKNAVELQRARDIQVNIKCKNIGAGALFADTNCTGYLKGRIEFEDINQGSGQSWGIVQDDQSDFTDIDLDIIVKKALPLTGAGAILYGAVRLAGNCPRRLNISGENMAVGSGISGWPLKQITNGDSGAKTLPASPATYVNVGPKAELIVHRTVSNFANVSATSRMRADHVIPVISTTATTITVSGDMTDRYATTLTNVALIDGRGFVLSSALQPSAVAYNSGADTTTITVSAVPAGVRHVAQLAAAVAQSNRPRAPQLLESGQALQWTYSGSVDLAAYQAEV